MLPAFQRDWSVGPGRQMQITQRRWAGRKQVLAMCYDTLVIYCFCVVSRLRERAA